MLVAKNNADRVEARFAEKDLDYYCPDCNAPLILKKGRIRVHHFSHKAETGCQWGQGESIQHMNAKNIFCDEFLRRKCRAQVELEVSSLPNDRRADVMIWSPSGKQQYAIELQHSKIDYESLERRTDSYIHANVRVIWIPFLQPKYEKQLLPASFGGFSESIIEKFSPRPFERWIHGFYFGKMFMYAPIQGVLYKAHMEDFEIEVPYSEWYDDTGDTLSAGGYTRISKRWKNLRIYGPYHLNQIQISPFKREAKSIGKHNYPKGIFGEIVDI